MQDVFQTIFKKFGIWSVVFAATLALVVWGFAHFMAAPNSEVSILWGLARYTKSGSSPEKKENTIAVQSQPGGGVSLTYDGLDPANKTLRFSDDKMRYVFALADTGAGPVTRVRVFLLSSLIYQTEPWLAEGETEWIFQTGVQAEEGLPRIAEYPKSFDLIAKEVVPITLGVRTYHWPPDTRIKGMLKVVFHEQTEPRMYPVELLIEGSRKH